MQMRLGMFAVEKRKHLGMFVAPCACACAIKCTRARRGEKNQHKKNFDGLCPNVKNECFSSLHKWKNHFYEMKEDVGMSRQEDAYIATPRHRKSFITPSLHLLFLSRPQHTLAMYITGIFKSRCICALFCLNSTFITNKPTFSAYQRCRDG